MSAPTFENWWTRPGTLALDTYLRQPLGFRVLYTDTLTRRRSESVTYSQSFYLNSASQDLDKFKPLWMRHKESSADKAAVAEWFARAESRRQPPSLLDRMLGPRLLEQQRNWRCRRQQVETARRRELQAAAVARCQAIQAEMARRRERQWAPCGYGWQWHSWAWKARDPFTALRTTEQWLAENWKNRSIAQEC